LKAKIEPRINLKGRTNLEEVIPLSTPFVLFVDPSNICNFKCKFCPTGHNDLIKKSNRIQTLMDFNLYKKIIDDLKEFDKPLKVLRLYKEGEPLLNPYFSEMIKYAKNKEYVNYIDTTTNGFLLIPHIAKSIIEAGLNKINISVNGLSDSQFLEFSGAHVKFDKYVENIINLYNNKKDCEIVIKTTEDFLSEEDKNKLYKIDLNLFLKI